MPAPSARVHRPAGPTHRGPSPELRLSAPPRPVTPRDSTEQEVQGVAFRAALAFWAKLGWISFGGPAAQIAIMHAELVERRRWISERRFLHALNFCMLLPGPEAQQLATYIGWLLHRSVGGLLAGCLFVLPSLLILIALSWVYLALGDRPLVAGLFYGIKPAVTAIVFHAAWRIGSRTLGNAWLWAIAAGALVGMLWLSLPFPVIIGAAALIGIVGGRIAPQRFVAGGHASPAATGLSALIDDHTPIPAHARFRIGRFAAVLLAGLLLWLLPIGLLVGQLGADHVLSQMAWFFTQAALLTFGGAYAVLPYVTEAAVNTHGWIGPTQMLDGLALGETTPGPLIMVVVFVAFVGGHGAAFLGADAPMLAGVLAALLVTWFTFLPSFVFILAGGPIVESSRGAPRLAAPLTAITAAVVGVILQLALFFAWHVFWPQGFEAPADTAALLIALLAALALFGFRRGVIEVILGAALLGLGWHLLGG